MKSIWKTMAIACCITTITCGRVAQKEEDEQEFWWALLFIDYQESGNCVHSQKSGTELGVLRCSRASRTQCHEERKLASDGAIIITSETRNRLAGEWSTIADQHPACTTTAAALLASSTFAVTSDPDAERASNPLQVIDSCDAIGSSDISMLATTAQYEYLTSARGYMATFALQLGETACFNEVLDSEWEHDIVTGLDNGSLLLETSCFYGTNAITDVCSTSEKNLANPFDFAIPL